MANRFNQVDMPGFGHQPAASPGTPQLAQSFSLTEMALTLAEAGGLVRLPAEWSV